MKDRLPIITGVLLLGHLVLLTIQGFNVNTLVLVLSSLMIFAFCMASAVHLLGVRSALTFLAIAAVLGWFAEQMGDTRGWFFGDYYYTDVLGPRIFAVPAVIPLLWFSLAYIGYVLANLIVWKTPVDRSTKLSDVVWMSLLSAFIITAYDLSADPYMVHVAEAWIMEMTDGWYFGETVEGFFGWVIVAFTIITTFRLVVRKVPVQPLTHSTRFHALMPVLAYSGFMLFFVAVGYPHETRSIAVFAMGIPILAAVAGWSQWKHHLGDSAADQA